MSEELNGADCGVCGAAATTSETLEMEYEERLVSRDMDYWTPHASLVYLCDDCFAEHSHIVDRFFRPPEPTDGDISEFLDAFDPADIFDHASPFEVDL